MKFKRIYLKTLLLASAPALPLIVASSVQAHPWFEADTAHPGQSYSSTINIPHGCDEKNGATKITMVMPEGITDPKGKNNGKWKATTMKAANGAPMVIWQGGLIPASEAGEFKLSFKIGNVKVGKTIYFPVIENCQNDKVRHWSQFPSETLAEDDIESPAAILEIISNDSKKHDGDHHDGDHHSEKKKHHHHHHHHDH